MVRLPEGIDGHENTALSSGATSVPHGEDLIPARLPSHEYAIHLSQKHRHASFPKNAVSIES
jgi:hypothetical protein